MSEGFFGGLKFSILFFLGKKIWQVFFGWLDLSRDFLGYSKCSWAPGVSSVVRTTTRCGWYDE